MLPSARARGLTDRGAPRFCRTRAVRRGASAADHAEAIHVVRGVFPPAAASRPRGRGRGVLDVAAPARALRASAPRARSRCARQPRFWHAAEQKNDATRPVRHVRAVGAPQAAQEPVGASSGRARARRQLPLGHRGADVHLPTIASDLLGARRRAAADRRRRAELGRQVAYARLGRGYVVRGAVCCSKMGELLLLVARERAQQAHGRRRRLRWFIEGCHDVSRRARWQHKWSCSVMLNAINRRLSVVLRRSAQVVFPCKC